MTQPDDTPEISNESINNAIDRWRDTIESREEASTAGQMAWLFWHSVRTPHPHTNEQVPAEHCTHMTLAWMQSGIIDLEDLEGE